MMRKFLNPLLIASLLWGAFSCGGGSHTPKPRGYFRIDLPEKSYLLFDSSSYPYSFEYPAMSKLNTEITPEDEHYWMNIEYPELRGTIHLSYKAVQGNLPALLEDAHSLANKHVGKATYLEPLPVIRDSAKVYGLIYDIRGTGVASTIQFYLTDSVSHYVRGALYFTVAPNNDSLAPVIDYVRDDINHLINTFAWNKLLNNRHGHM